MNSFWRHSPWLLLCFVAGATLRCDRLEDYTKPPKNRARFFLGLRSYMTMKQSLQSLGRERWSYQISKQDGSVPDGRIGCISQRSFSYEIVSVTIENVTHLNEEGDVDLKLINDRLIGATFNPKNHSKYLKKLHTHLQLSRIIDITTFSAGFVARRVMPNTDISVSATGVTWHDSRLRELENKLLSR